MGELTRRDKGVPVQARRLGTGGVTIPPATAGVPGLAAEATPPVPPVGVQNVVYVVAPPPIAAPVTEVHHHHHTTTQVVLPARRRRRQKGTSFLGTLGLVVGGLACAAAFLPQVARFAVPIAIGGLGMAGLAWVGAVLLRRVGATMPFAGLLVCAAGYGLGLWQTGQAQSTYDRLRTRSPVPLPAVRIDPPTAVPGPVAPAPVVPAPVAPAPSQPGPAAKPTPRSPADPQRTPSIFDSDSPGWTKPAAGH